MAEDFRTRHAPRDVSPHAEREEYIADGGYAAVARRLAQGTTKGLLIALIFVAGLGFGREALRWWKGRGIRDLTGPLATADGLGDPSRRQELLFGDSPWQIDAESFLGDDARATAALVDRCRQSAATSPLPGEPPRPGEVQFLRHLSVQAAAGSQTGVCRVYRLEGAFPMAVGLRTSTPHAPREGERHAERDEYKRQPVVESGFRVVTWGLAVPRGAGRFGRRTPPVKEWTLYVFHAANPVATATGGLPEVALPEGSRRLVTMRVAGGGSMTTFQGAARIGGWQRFFDDWFSSHGWTSGGGWPSAGPMRHCRYRPAGGRSPASAEVEIAEDGRGGLTGLVMVNPPAGEK
jgi:hypothetical protein